MQLCHEQVYIKVNAQCDRDIAPLVSALNEIRNVITLDSCQQGGAYDAAYVFFTYGNSWQALASLLQEMSSQLSVLRLPCGYSLWLQWRGSNDRPYAEIALETEHITTIAQAIRQVASILSDRMTELVGGSDCIVLRS